MLASICVFIRFLLLICSQNTKEPEKVFKRNINGEKKKAKRNMNGLAKYARQELQLFRQLSFIHCSLF